MHLLKTLLASLHQIDRDSDTVKQQEVNNADAEQFVSNLISEIKKNKNKRAFSFKSSTSEVSSTLLKIFKEKDIDDNNDLFQSNCYLIAKRILSSENRSVEKYPNMKHPKKGSLITTFNIDDEGNYFIIIAKIETEEFLSDINLVLTTGLPSQKPALKTATIELSELVAGEISTNLVLTDSSSSISKYWSEDFLESKELTSNEKNTKNAFTEIERVIARKLKKDAPSDYTELRNNLVGYFKGQESFNFDEMVNQVFGKYPMQNDSITLDSVKEKVNALSSSSKFDTQFDLVPNEIKAKFKSTYKVTNEVELRTFGHVEDLRHIIRASKNLQGERILEIKVSDSAVYESFLFEND